MKKFEVNFDKLTSKNIPKKILSIVLRANALKIEQID